MIANTFMMMCLKLSLKETGDHWNFCVWCQVCGYEFEDGTIGSYAANVIVESMFADCDVDGNQHVLIDEVVDHKPDGSAVLDADQFVVVKGRQYVRKTTKGW